MACGGNPPVGPTPFGDVTAGRVTQFPEGTLTHVSMTPVFLGRDAAGFYALTSTCTHAGCTVAAQGSGPTAQLACPCHGSLYDRDGAVVRGPAAVPLAHFAVEVANGNVIIHGGTQVDAATRTPAA
jgi:cytochrome b6-f complex iron-sulfur subunit